MAQQALKGTAYADCVHDGLRWNKELKSAHDGGPRSRADLLPCLGVKGDLKGKKIVLIDDLITTGRFAVGVQGSIGG